MGSTIPAANTIETRLFINNEFVDASSGRLFEVLNPATEAVTARVHEADAQDVDRAVEAAVAAFPAWSTLGGFQRAEYLYKLADLYEKYIEEFAWLEAQSMGRPVGTYREPIACADFLRYVAGQATDVKGDSSLVTPGLMNIVLRQPFGVCAAITPWNVPVSMLTLKMAPAIVAGNTLVIKSSEKAPLTSLLVAKLCKEAGVPPGVVNVLSGFGDPCGTALAKHMAIRKISFTGSVRTGKAIMELAARSNLKKVSLELGGKSPLLIFEDADLDKAAAGAARSILLNSGQNCIASSRVYVHQDVATLFCEKFVEAMKQLGTNPSSGNDPLDSRTKRGPQATKSQFDTIMSYINIAKQNGDEVLLGGSREGNKGFYIEPTIIKGSDEKSKIMQEEIFGPVVCINTFTDEQEVVRRANDSEYGLYASAFTKDIFRGIRLAKAFEAGLVGINCTSPTNALDMPYGGYKQSGQGRENGIYAIQEWTEIKTVFFAES